MVPTFAENCLRQSRHFHIFRLRRNECLVLLQRGQIAPSGQRICAMNSTQMAGSSKYRVASSRLLGNGFEFSTVKLL